jgi:hypothetical protein
VDAFNLFAGIVGILGLVLSIWTYFEAKHKEVIETEKARTLTHRLNDMLIVVNAVSRQASLIATLSDRDETSKKELKHLLVSQLATVEAAQQGLSQIRARSNAWEFGLVDQYLTADDGGSGERPRDGAVARDGSEGVRDGPQAGSSRV